MLTSLRGWTDFETAGGSYLADNADPAAKELLRDLVKKRRLIWEDTDAGIRYHLVQGWSV